MTEPRTGPASHILIVDDDDYVRAAVANLLAIAGHEISLARDGSEACELLEGGRFDAVVSDINMPSLDGMGLLRMVRQHDADLPVILMTGEPKLETAMEAVALGALRYLTKPVSGAALRGAVDDAVRLHRLARVRREIIGVLGAGDLPVADPAQLEPVFARALESLTMAFQPIVCWSEQRVYGYEALARPKEPTLPHPGALFAAAERLGRLPDLGRVIRRLIASAIRQAPQGAPIFVNLHPRDLLDDDLFAPTAPLSLTADRIVLEITERAPLHEIRDVRGRTGSLRELGFRIALDDLGAGYAGLNSFAQLEPEVIKIDFALARGVDREPTKQKLIRSMLTLCGEMGKAVIVEGVETEAERDTLLGLGCDLFQGFLFARPEPRFAVPVPLSVEPPAPDQAAKIDAADAEPAKTLLCPA